MGAREDWRYADLRTAHPRHWWWLSFFAVQAIQARPTGLLCPGISLLAAVLRF